MITATYSPEDNKIRLYASRRLDDETFARVKAAGFKWAPKQELFVAPKWTPEREDLAMELAGEIEAEEMTLAERAALKADRLDALAAKRNREAQGLARHADELSQAFYMGQPILVGHHSERKARKTQERMQAAQAKSHKAAETANYWLYRATGVERFANMKNDPRTRANRIKTLLAELRDLQRGINDAHAGIALWDRFDTPEKVMWAICNANGDTLGIPWGTYSKREEIADLLAFRDECIARLRIRFEGPTRRRWIEHILNRLAFERSMLGDVPRYSGPLSPVIIQAFAREHGTEKPKATATDPGYFQLESPLPLPLHLADSTYLELSEDEWRDVMQATGYTVPEDKPRRVSTKPAPASLINPTPEEAERLQAIWNRRARLTGRTTEENSVKPVTQAQWSGAAVGSYSPFTTIEIDASGAKIYSTYKGKTGEPVARIRQYSGGRSLYAPDAVIVLSDKPCKALPLDFDAIEAALSAAEAPDEIAFAGPFDPAKLTIERARDSTTQGHVYLSYNGKRFARHSDHIRSDGGEYVGHPDEYWHVIAARFIDGERSAAA